MWNPIQGVKDDWSVTSGTYGKIVVTLFYLLVWLMILLNLYQAMIDRLLVKAVSLQIEMQHL